MNGSIRVSAKTVDDAITEALIQLGVTSDCLEYEVIEKGSAGFLGIGMKQAVIEARRKPGTAEEEEDTKIRFDVTLEPEKKGRKEKVKEHKKEKREPEKKAEPKAYEKQDAEKELPKEEKKEEVVKAPVEKEESVPARKEKETAVVTEESKKAVEAFLLDTLKAMGMEVEITSEVDADGALSIDMKGENMGILIGKRGQTLDSLQHLVSLVINKHSEEYIRVKLDTENYRERRKETLEQLAKNIAYKVKRTRRPASLEPMNPYERRIIHSALQDDKFVYTKSEGEDPFRHVVVLPKKEAIPQRRYYKSYDKGYKTNYDRSAAGTRETAEKLTSEE